MSALPVSKQAFFGASFGTMVEYYDYALFSTLLPIIAPLFFPADSIYQSLIEGYYLLLIVVIARPFGGIAFGYLGDRYGRRKALLTSIYGIAFATIAIGLIPVYEKWGVWSITCIFIAKAVQTFCFGGEFNGAGIYITELAQGKNEGLLSGLLVATTLFGSLIASLIGIVLTFHFMPSWCWRIAFFFGGLIGIIGIISRKNLLESPNFIPADRIKKLPVLIREFPLEILAGVFIGGFITVPFTTVLTFIYPILLSKGYLSNHQFMLTQTFFILIAVVTLILAGRIADKISTAKVMQVGALGLTIFAYPLMLIVNTLNLRWVCLASSVLIVINEMLFAPSNAYFKQLFPMQCRYRASSLSFCLGMSVLGGITPLVENYLYQKTNSITAVSSWLIFVGLGTLLSLHFVNIKQDTVQSLELSHLD